MLIVPVLTILGAWAACAILLIGVGALTLRRFSNPSGIFYAFWVGLGVATAFLEIWSLFLPVNVEAPICLAALATWGIVENHAVLTQEARRIQAMLDWPYLFWFTFIVYMALRATGPCRHYDTGLYGATAIRWITTYPTVPGLANLHGRLGFNSSLFLLDATLREGLSKALYFRLMTGLIFAALWTVIFPSCLRVIRHNAAKLTDWYFGILAIPTIYWATRGAIVGTVTDEPAAVACLLGAGLVLQNFVSCGTDELFATETTVLSVTSATLLAVGVSLKESTLVFAALIWMLGVASCSLTKKKGTIVLAWVAPAMFILVPWLIRGILLTGYPLFPSPILGVHASWRVPTAVATFYVEWIRAYGRIPYVPIASTKGSAWLLPWIHRAIHERGDLQLPAFMSSVGVLACTLGWRTLERAQARAAWLLAGSIPSLAFWFFEAPDPRFGEAAIWVTVAVLGALGIVSASKKYRWVRPQMAAVGILAMILWCVFSFDWQMSYRPSLSTRSLSLLPSPILKSQRTLSGLLVYMPARGQQCWSAPLPCTPYFNQTLRLRVPGNMRWGFSSQGMPQLPPH